MKLADYQRAVVSHLLGDAPESAPALGDPERLALYRGMVQRRLRALVRFAFRSLVDVVGDERFAASFTRFLALAPPRTPLLRDAAHAYGDFARRDPALLTDGPAFLPALIDFEAHVWRIAYAAPARSEPVVELDFALPPVFDPLAHVLRADHAIQRVRAQAERALPERPTTLWIYRDAHDHVRFVETSRLMAELHDGALRDPSLTLTALVHATACALARTLDERLLRELSETLSGALSVGALRGSRPG